MRVVGAYLEDTGASPPPNRTRKKILSAEKADRGGGARATVNDWADPVVRECGELMLMELSILWEEGLRGKLLCARRSKLRSLDSAIAAAQPALLSSDSD